MANPADIRFPQFSFGGQFTTMGDPAFVHVSQQSRLRVLRQSVLSQGQTHAEIRRIFHALQPSDGEPKWSARCDETTPFEHRVIPRHTQFRMTTDVTEATIQDVYAALDDATRNEAIANDVARAIEAGSEHSNAYSAAPARIQLAGPVRSLRIPLAPQKVDHSFPYENLSQQGRTPCLSP
jgi:hypothetical protein